MTKTALGNSNVRLPNLKKLVYVLKFSFPFLLFSLQVFAHAPQKITLDMHNEKLVNVLKEIEKQSSCRFSYSSELALAHQSLTIRAKEKDVHEVLDQLLKSLGLDYEEGSDQVVAIFAAVSKTKTVINPSVDTTIRGKITNREGEPLSGASVTVKGTKNGTTTTTTGEFVLNGVDENATLVISSVGFEPQEVKLSGGRLSSAIVLESEAGMMTDVVVTGFQRINKKNFTGAAVTLRAEDIKMEGVVDVSRMLEGRAAGVSVQNVSGTFGSAPKIRIRGATSINGDNKPLWVIDGVVQEDIINISNDQLSSGDPTTLLGSSVAGINSNDIETFDILKDAAATALYGARAMNGVVVITTKKGRAGKPVVSYTGNFSTQLKPTYTEYNIMNSVEQMSVLAEIDRKGILSPDILSQADYGVYGKMYDLINKPDANGNFALLNTTEAKAAFLKRYATTNTDWFDVLF